jgi:hypothetical protein
VSNWKIGTYPFSKTALLEGDKYIGTMDEPEKAQRVAALLNEQDALRAVLRQVQSEINGSFRTEQRFEPELIRAIDAALEQPAAQSSERAE